MTYTANPPIKKGTVLGGQDRPFSTYPHSERSLKLYDRNARSISAMLTDDRCRLYDSLLQSESTGYTLIQATVKRPETLEVTGTLQQGVILALDEGRGIVLHCQDSGTLVLYGIIQQMEDRIRVSALDPGAEEGMRNFLKGCYSGWHHMFHEVVAMASGFTAVSVYDTKIDELVQLIQVPPRFPV